MKILAVTQARIGSTRLPHKVVKKINGETLLGIHINRILKSSMINSLFIATSTKKEDDIIQKEAIRLNVNCFGEDQQKFPNTPPSERAKNRRVQFNID